MLVCQRRGPKSGDVTVRRLPSLSQSEQLRAVVCAFWILPHGDGAPSVMRQHVLAVAYSTQQQKKQTTKHTAQQMRRQANHTMVDTTTHIEKEAEERH